MDKAFSHRVLLLEHDARSLDALSGFLHDQDGIRVETVSHRADAIKRLQANDLCAVVTGDLGLLERLRDDASPIPVIAIASPGDVDGAVAAMRLGACDVVPRPINLGQFQGTLKKALASSAQASRHRAHSFHGILSKNPRMHALFDTVVHISENTSTVLIEGATGTGKEMIARAIHTISGRQGPLVAVNCAGLPENLLESELFGHEKGAFTSAFRDRKGRFELADGGTIFLDEAGDIPGAMQAKLLRVLQERCFERVGGTQNVSVNVRVIAATNRDLLDLVQNGVFREDLYYRLNVIKIKLPRLADRPEDIPLLALHFAEKYSNHGMPAKRISPRAMSVIIRHDWPGNIRELENAIERACVTSNQATIEVENLPSEIVAPAPTVLPASAEFDRPLPELRRAVIEDLEERYLRFALDRAHGNIGRCARLCRMSRRSVTAKINRYCIDKKAYKRSLADQAEW